MPKESTSINLDTDLRKEAKELFSTLGMDMSTAVTIFLSQAVRDQISFLQYLSFEEVMKDVLHHA
jgi:addiction module RelB/DinJ family antitoxin